jgi:hypothetical protein
VNTGHHIIEPAIVFVIELFYFSKSGPQGGQKWMLKFHPDKCKTMRIGRSKVEKHEYTLKADLKPMEETIAEKDVGVTIYHS